MSNSSTAAFPNKGAAFSNDERVLLGVEGRLPARVETGVGLGLVLARAQRAAQEMFLAAAEALAECVTQADLERGCIFPQGCCLRSMAAAVAISVMEVARRELNGNARNHADVQAEVDGARWRPEYGVAPLNSTVSA